MAMRSILTNDGNNDIFLQFFKCNKYVFLSKTTPHHLHRITIILI